MWSLNTEHSSHVGENAPQLLRYKDSPGDSTICSGSHIVRSEYLPHPGSADLHVVLQSNYKALAVPASASCFVFIDIYIDRPTGRIRPAHRLNHKIYIIIAHSDENLKKKSHQKFKMTSQSPTPFPNKLSAKTGAPEIPHAPETKLSQEVFPLPPPVCRSVSPP